MRPIYPRASGQYARRTKLINDHNKRITVVTDDANITKAWTIIWSGYHYETRTILWYRWSYQTHYSDVMSATVSQITGVSIVCINLCSDADQRKHQSSAWLAFERGIHRWPVDTPNKGPVTRKHHEPPHSPPIPCNQGLPRDTFMLGTSQTKRGQPRSCYFLNMYTNTDHPMKYS